MSRKELNEEIDKLIATTNRLLDEYTEHRKPVLKRKITKLESRTSKLLNKVKRFVKSRKKSS